MVWENKMAACGLPSSQAARSTPLSSLPVRFALNWARQGENYEMARPSSVPVTKMYSCKAQTQKSLSTAAKIESCTNEMNQRCTILFSSPDDASTTQQMKYVVETLDDTKTLGKLMQE